MQTPSRASTAVKDTLAKLGPDPLPALVPSTESESETEDEDETAEPVVGWHHDSYRE